MKTIAWTETDWQSDRGLEQRGLYMISQNLKFDLSHARCEVGNGVSTLTVTHCGEESLFFNASGLSGAGIEIESICAGGLVRLADIRDWRRA